MVKVQLPKVEESTRKQLNLLKVNAGFKTLDETINHTIDEAEKVPALNKEINELRAECFALQKDKGVLLEDYQKARTQVKELEEERDMNEFYNDKIERMRMQIKELEEENKRLRRNNEPYRPEDDPYTQG